MYRAECYADVDAAPLPTAEQGQMMEIRTHGRFDPSAYQSNRQAVGSNIERFAIVICEISCRI